MLTVPDETPFIAITKWVFAAIARAGTPRAAGPDGDQQETHRGGHPLGAAACAVVGVVGDQRHTVRRVRRRRRQLIAATPGTPASVVERAVEAVGMAAQRGD